MYIHCLCNLKFKNDLVFCILQIFCLQPLWGNYHGNTQGTHLVISYCTQLPVKYIYLSTRSIALNPVNELSVDC